MKSHLILIFFLILTFALKGQKKICKNIIVNSDTLVLDTNTVLAGSIYIYNKGVEQKFEFLPQQNAVLINSKIYDTLFVCYNSLNFRLKTDFKHRDTSLILHLKRQKKDFFPADNKNFFISNTEKIKTQGIISKSMTIGNNQDLVLNSKLDLSLEGNLADAYLLEAKIKDDNTPIQPDGTTTTITDFGEVYVKIFDTVNTYFLGDANIKSIYKDFATFEKQTKAFYYQRNDTIKNIRIGSSISKGTYNRLKIKPIEGNQGPYKLTGKNHETFILVIAGSEKVYIDGQLKQRGENKDYIIDYNSAEITFMPSCPVKKESRIIVEFQYSDKFYPNFFSFADLKIKKNNYSFLFSRYVQNDNKNNPYYSLTDKQLDFLRSAGDTQNLAYPYFDTAKYSKNKILYRKKDTVVNGVLYKGIYVKCDDTNAILYEAQFIYVGKNKGDYVIAENTVNGRVYKWIAPKNGIKQGEFIPSVYLKTPKKHSLTVFSANFNNKKTKLGLTTVFSDYDKNTFSPVDDKDNKGYAHTFYITKKIANNLFFFNWQLRTQNFSPFEYFRQQEFDRNWNYYLSDKGNENLFSLGYQKNFSDTGKWKTALQFLHNSLYYKGLKFKNQLFYSTEKYLFQINQFFLVSQKNNLKSNFIKSDISASRKIKNYYLNLIWQTERNQIDSLNYLDTNGFYFQNFGFGFFNKDSSFKFFYYKRFDFRAQEKFVLQGKSDNYTFDLNRKIGKKITLRANAFYRILNDETGKQDNLAFSQGSFFAFKPVNFSYSIRFQSGLERKKEYVYVEVEPGKGTFKWIDYNENGIRELNEFEYARFSDEAKYIRLEMQSDQYLKVYTSVISEQLTFKPALFFDDNKLIFKILKPFSTNMFFNSTNKTKDFLFFRDTLPVSSNLMFKTISKLDFEKIILSFEFGKNQNINTYVWDKSGITVQSYVYTVIYNRINVSNQISIKTSQTKSFSDIFSSQNYEFTQKEVSNTLILKKYGTSFGLCYKEKKSLKSAENLYSFQTNFQFSKKIKKTSVKIVFYYIKNNFSGNSGTQLAYRMLEGLGTGNNFVNELVFSHPVIGNLQANINFSLRYTNQQLIGTSTFNFSVLF